MKECKIINLIQTLKIKFLMGQITLLFWWEVLHLGCEWEGTSGNEQNMLNALMEHLKFPFVVHVFCTPSTLVLRKVWKRPIMAKARQFVHYFNKSGKSMALQSRPCKTQADSSRASGQVLELSQDVCMRWCRVGVLHEETSCYTTMFTASWVRMTKMSCDL